MIRAALDGFALGLSIAVELSRRHAHADDAWAQRLWERVAPHLRGAVLLRPGPAGSIIASWPLEGEETICWAAGLALRLRETLTDILRAVELRGGIATGVIDASPPVTAVERTCERLALAAIPGQWLVTEEVARGLRERFEVRPSGVIARWPIPLPDGVRAIAGELEPPALPSAVSGPSPALLIGRVEQRQRLLDELAVVAQSRMRTVIVSAPAGAGKSHLLRRVLADSPIDLAAGVAFPPLGSAPLEQLQRLLKDLTEGIEEDSCMSRAEDSLPSSAESYHTRLGALLAQAACRRARHSPCAVVIDDVHWAHPTAAKALELAIAASAPSAPLAWVLSARTSGLARLSALVELADVVIELPPLSPADRWLLLEARLGPAAHRLRAHVAHGPERGNPLYLEHLAAAISEGYSGEPPPGTLHEAVLCRIAGLAARARQLTHWSRRRWNAAEELESLERELGDWLDRLETSDLADLATIGSYLAALRAVDTDLVVARSLLGLPVSSNRRLALAVERLAAASTDALLDYLNTMALAGRPEQAAHDAAAAAGQAERCLRLHDAQRLMRFACDHDPRRAEWLLRSGDLALALGRPMAALAAYGMAVEVRGSCAAISRRTARARALLGEVTSAIGELEGALRRSGADDPGAYALALDLARLRAVMPPHPPQACPPTLRRAASRVSALAAGDEPSAALAARWLVLEATPVAVAAELIQTAVLCSLAGVRVDGLVAAASQAAATIGNPCALGLLEQPNRSRARRVFLHCDS